MRVYATYNIKGGVGKTSTAVNLAYLCAASGRRTLLWGLIGVIGGLGAGLVVSRKRSAATTTTPAWTNYPTSAGTDSTTTTAVPDPELARAVDLNGSLDKTTPAYQDRLG